jgi:hypothetical protein
MTKTFSTYSKKKSLKTLSRTVFLKVAAPPISLSQESDVEVEFDGSSGLNDENLMFEQDLFNQNSTNDSFEKCVLYPSVNEKLLSPGKRSDTSDNFVREEIKESPPKKRNTGRRVLKMKSNSISRHEHISDILNQVSLKDPERKEVKVSKAEALPRNPINHVVTKASNTYASIARSYVEANEV